MPEMVKGLEKLELLVVADPHPTTFAAISERKNGTYLLPICTQFEMLGLAHRFQPLAAVGRADRQADLRIEERLRGHLPACRRSSASPTRCSRTSRSRTIAPMRRGPAARDQPRRLVDRLFRPVAGAAEGAHEEPGQVRPGDAARQGRRARDRRRLLRPAVAVLGHAGDQASGHAHRSTTPTCT